MRVRACVSVYAVLWIFTAQVFGVINSCLFGTVRQAQLRATLNGILVSCVCVRISSETKDGFGSSVPIYSSQDMGVDFF